LLYLLLSQALQVEASPSLKRPATQFSTALLSAVGLIPAPATLQYELPAAEYSPAPSQDSQAASELAPSALNFPAGQGGSAPVSSSKYFPFGVFTHREDPATLWPPTHSSHSVDPPTLNVFIGQSTTPVLASFGFVPIGEVWQNPAPSVENSPSPSHGLQSSNVGSPVSVYVPAGQSSHVLLFAS